MFYDLFGDLVIAFNAAEMQSLETRNMIIFVCAQPPTQNVSNFSLSIPYMNLAYVCTSLIFSICAGKKHSDCSPQSPVLLFCFLIISWVNTLTHTGDG